MTLTVRNSELDHNGVVSTNPNFGLDHNIYAGSLTQLTVQNSYVHDALGGHEIKSRAFTNVITGNRIEDGGTAQTSYSIDLADGGQDTVQNNVIEKGANSPNRYIVNYGAEGTYAGSSLLLDGNTIINDRSAGATVLFNRTMDANHQSIPATITGNTIYGVDPSLLYQDNFGPPFDTTSKNSFPAGAAPPLDMSSPFAVPEPGAAWALPLLLVTVTLVRRRRVAGRAAPRY